MQNEKTVIVEIQLAQCAQYLRFLKQQGWKQIGTLSANALRRQRITFERAESVCIVRVNNGKNDKRS